MVVATLFCCANVYFILTAGSPLTLSLTFLLLFSLIAWAVCRTLLSAVFNPFILASAIFFYLFFVVAPILQLDHNPDRLPFNGMYINPGTVVTANLLVSLFFLVTYVTAQHYTRRMKGPVPAPEPDGVRAGNKTFILLLVSVACAAAAFILLSDLRNLSETGGGGAEVKEMKMMALLLGKFVAMIPIMAFFKFMSLDRARIRAYLPMLIALLVLMLLAKNPLNEKRNALGPIYLTALYAFFPRRLSRNHIYFIVLFVLFVVFFPLSSLLTHMRLDAADRIQAFGQMWGDISVREVIMSHFLELHYDAWGNFLGVIEYARQAGFSMGYQLLGALLFFFPRSQWAAKPYGTGQVLAENYIAPQSGFDFSNLSMSLPAEGYINFGVFGVVLFAFVLGRVFAFMQHLMQRSLYARYLALYFSFYLFFLLRGDLLNGIAYFAGALCAFLFVGWVADNLSRFTFKSRF